MKIYCQYVTSSTKEVAKKLGLNANYVNNIESYFVTNNTMTQDQLTDDKIEERAKRIQDFLDNKKEEAKQVRYAIPEYETEEFNPEIDTDLAYFDPNFTYTTLSIFKNASDFINWKNKQQNPDLFKTPQDAYLYELWKVMEEEFNGNSSEEAKKIAESKLINYRKEIAPYTKEDINNNEVVKKASANNINEKDIQSQLWKHMQNMGLSVSGSKGMQEFLKTHNLQSVQQAIESPEVQKEMDEIKQKAIADSTFMKAPNGRKSNLTERQWLQVRTKAFKDWFGDWEKVVPSTEAAEELISYVTNISNRNNRFSKLAQLLLNNNLLPYNLKYFKIDNNRDDIEKAAGLWSSFVNYIEVLGNNVSQESIDKHLLHELIHYNTEQILQDYKDNKITNNAKREAIKNLYDIITYAKDFLSKDIQANKNKYIEIAKRQNSTIDSRVFYAFDNQGSSEIDEFISEVFTNPGFQEILNNIPYKESKQTIWSKIKNAISSIFGFDINKGSVLEEALKASSNLLQNNNVSKVVDENGEPLVVYHGSNEYGFKVFDPSKSDDKISLFASSSKWIASTYTSFKPLENTLVRKALLKGNAIDLIKNEDWKSLEKLINSVIDINLPRPEEFGYPMSYDGNEKVLDEVLAIQKELDNPNLTEEEQSSLLADLTKAEDKYYYSGNYTFRVKQRIIRGKNNIEISIDDSYDKEFNSSYYNEGGVIFRGSPEELIDALTFDTKVYDLFLNIKNPLTLDNQVNEYGHANNWNNLDFAPAAKEVQNRTLWGEATIGTHKETKTRDVAAYAKEHGYDGVIFKQIADKGGYPGYQSLNPMTDADYLYEDMYIGEDSFNATNKLESDIIIAFNSNQIKSATDNVGTFSRTNNDITTYTTPQGEIYGFVDKEGNVYLDETKISPEHPIHEYTHLWDRVVQQKNPKLWNRGIELMKQTTLWNEILNSEHYGKAWQQLGINGERLNNLIASEVHARLTGTEGEALLKKLAKKKGQSNIISKLKEWLLDIWKTLGETFGTWNKESLDNLTLEDFNHLTIRDFAKGYNPVSNTFMYNDKSNVQSNNIQAEEFKIEYTPIGKSRQTYTVKGSHIYNKEGKEVFAKNSKDRNKIFANLAVLQGRAVVIQHKNSSYIVNNRDQIISVTSGKIMEWGKENGDRKAILEAAKEKFESKNKQSSQDNNIIKESDYSKQLIKVLQNLVNKIKASNIKEAKAAQNLYEWTIQAQQAILDAIKNGEREDGDLFLDKVQEHLNTLAQKLPENLAKEAMKAAKEMGKDWGKITTNAQAKEVKTILNFKPEEAEFYSGAAEGSDKAWEEAATKAGIKVKNYTTTNWDNLSNEWKEKIDKEYQEVVNTLGRKALDINSYAGKLVRRDMMQADKADAIFAVGEIAFNGYVNGDTGYATTRGIIRDIPIYLFDQKDNIWKIWNKEQSKFIPTSQPTLTKNAAVIGTRKLQDNGRNAISELIDFSLGRSAGKKFSEQSQETVLQKTQKVINQIQEDTSKIKLTEDEHNYINTETNDLFARTTTVIQANKDGKPFEENDWKLPSTTIGTQVDRFVRDFFDGKLGDLNTLGDRYYNATTEQWQAFMQDLQKLKDFFDGKTKESKGKKLHIVPKDITLTGTVEVTDEKGNKKLLPVAGTVDLLAYDDEGNFYIYDMKTKRSANIYDSDEVKWKNQLSLYKQLLEQKYGVKVVGTGIIPIKVDYLAPKTENGTAEYTAKEGQLYNHGKAYTNAQPRQVKELDMIHRRTTEPLDIRFEKLKDAEKKLLKDKPIAPVTEEFNPNAGKSVFTINLDDDMSEAMEADADAYAKARAFFEEKEKQNAVEEQKAEDRYNKALAYLDEQVKTMPYTGKTINTNEESTLTKLGKLITPTQLNDRINYIARSFSSQIDLAVEEMTETIKEQLAEAKAEKDETKINKLNHALKVLENPDKQREKAVKMLGSNTLINRMKQEIQDVIDYSKNPNIKNQYQILSDYFIDIFNLATPIMEQYENVKFTIHKTNILDGSNLKEGASIEMTESTEDLQNEENAYEDSDDGDRAATGNEGWSFKIKFEDPHNTLTRDTKKVLYNLVKMNGDEVDVDDLGKPRYIAFNQAYAILLDKLANKIVEPQDFVQKDKDGNISYPLLEEMANKFPWVNQVLDALDVDNTDGYGNLGTMFYSAFKRYFTHYYMLRGNKVFPMNEMTPVESALAETTGNYEHGNVLDENSIYNSDKTINQEHINNIKEKIKRLDSLAAHFNDNYIEIAEGLNSILRSIGFNTTVQELIGLSQDGEYMKNYRILKSSINRILSIAEKLENKHLIQESKDEIKKIAPILGTVSELNNCTSFRQNGNNYPSYTPCSFMSNMIDHLKSDKYFKQYIEEQFKPYDKWFYDEKEGRYLNGWLNLIMTNPDVRNHLSLKEIKFIAEGSSDIFNNDSQAAIEYNEWLPNQIRKSFLHLYFDTPNDSSSKIQYADYAFPIFSDSEMAAFIRMPKYIKNFRDRLTPKLRDVVLQEINRITKVNQREKVGVSKIQHFDTRGKDFLFIPEMNAYKKELFQFIDNDDMSGLDAFIDEKLKEIMKQKVEKALSADQESIIEFVMNSAKVKTKEEAIEKFAEFVWNNAYAQSQIIQLTVTDLAYYKNEIDFQKRYKEVYASGTRFNSESKYGKKNFNIIYLADAVVTSNSYGLVEETLNKAVEEKRLTLAEKYNILSMFSKIKSTDGQGFRTLTSYRSMLDMMGQWTPRLQALYERLNNGTWKYEDFENILQTLKPFAYTQTIQNDGLGGKIRIGHQIKDSEFVLLAIYNTLAMGGTKDISQNTGSPQLRALNMFMEENGIDAAIFESGVKTGGQGIIDINHSDTRAAKVLETKLPTKNKENKREYTLADAIMHEYTTYYKSKKEGAKAFNEASPSEKLEWGLLQMLRNGNITQEAFNKFTKKAMPTEVEVKEMLEKACKTVNKNGDILEDLNKNGIMLNTSVVHSIPTSDYMIAQQNPEHLFDAQSVAGSQNRNLIESDFPADFELKFKDSFDKNHVLKGNEINKLCSDLIIENLLEDFETIKADFKNIETIQKILIKAIQASNKYGNDMINALQIVEVNGKKQFNIPTNNINTLNKLQELVLSVFSNRITKQKNKKGAACTLVSSFGFTHDLHVIKDKEGNLQFEVYMPWHSQKHLAPFLVDVLDDDGKVIGKKIDIEKVKENDPKLLEGFGYRIPTEGKYSMMSFIIKGFLPQENGSTIIMPADTIVYAGEDFDIDKKFLQFYNYYKTKDGKYKTYEYDWSKGVAGNSRQARENMLLDLYRKVWGSPQIRDQVMSPGGYDTIKTDAYKTDIVNDPQLLNAWAKAHGINTNFIEELNNIQNDEDGAAVYNSFASDVNALNKSIKEATLDEVEDFLSKNKKTFDPLSMETFIYFHKQNMAGASLIGIYANNNVGQAKRQFSNLELKKEIVINNRTIKSLHDAYTTVEGKTIRISKLCAEFSAASVDNVKDPVLARLAQTPNTAYITCFMLCAGMTSEEISLVFNLPGFRDIIDLYGLIDAKTIKDLPKLLAIKAAKAKINKLAENDSSIDKVRANKMIEELTEQILSISNSIPSSDFNFDSDTMREATFYYNLYKNIDIKTDVNTDLVLMSSVIARMNKLVGPLLEIEAAAQDLRTVTQLGRADSPNGSVGITLAEMYRQKQALKAFNYKAQQPEFTLNNAEQLIQDDLINPFGDLETIRTKLQESPLAKLQAFYSLGIDSVPTVMRDLFTQTSESFQLELNYLFEESANYNLPTATIQDFMDSYIIYELTKSKMFGDSEEGTFAEKRNYYLYKFPADLQKMQTDPDLKEVFQLGALNRLRVNNGEIVLDKSGRVTEDVRNRFMRDFDSLLYGNDKAKKLAEDLFKYAYYKEGFKFSHNSFGNFFSTQFLSSFPEYIDTLRNIDNHLVDIDGKFFAQFMFNHLGEFVTKRSVKGFSRHGDMFIPDNAASVTNYRTDRHRYRYFEYMTLIDEMGTNYNVRLDPNTQFSKHPKYIILHDVEHDEINNKTLDYYNSSETVNDIYNRTVNPNLKTALNLATQNGFVSGMQSEEDFAFLNNSTKDELKIEDPFANETPETTTEEEKLKDYKPQEELKKQNMKPCPAPAGKKYSPEIQKRIEDFKKTNKLSERIKLKQLGVKDEDLI